MAQEQLQFDFMKKSKFEKPQGLPACRECDNKGYRIEIDGSMYLEEKDGEVVKLDRKVEDWTASCSKCGDYVEDDERINHLYQYVFKTRKEKR